MDHILDTEIVVALVPEFRLYTEYHAINEWLALFGLEPRVLVNLNTYLVADYTGL